MGWESYDAPAIVDTCVRHAPIYFQAQTLLPGWERDRYLKFV